MIILHFFTFDPGWIKPRPVLGRLEVFYDGTCGLCHAFVRFILSENKAQAAFRFTPLQDRFSPDAIPGSIVVQDQGALLYKSEAIFRVLASLGGIWKIFALVCSFIPTKLSDYVYDFIARIRHRIFTKPKENCPIVPSEMREFFR